MQQLNALAFRGTALAAPFQSILYPDDVLLSILQHPAGTNADIQAQAEAFAELLVRCHSSQRIWSRTGYLWNTMLPPRYSPSS